MISASELDVWLDKARALLTGNRIEQDGYRYTAPSLDTGDFGRKDYANQFLWDSCFHAITWRWIDPIMAQDELLALLSRQVQDGPDAGMIPHCNYWRGGAQWLWQYDDRSSITQPPLIGVAAELVYQRSQDKAFLEAVYAPLCAYHDWFDRRRDPDGDRLVCLIHPWESGGDVLPRWDHAMHYGPFDHDGWREGRIALAHKVVAFDTDAAALAADGSFNLETMDYNAIRAADMEALGRIAAELGSPDDAAAWQARADAVCAAFRAKMIVDGLPYDLEGSDEQPVIQESAGQFMTLFGGCPTPEQAERLVALLQTERFWANWPVSTSPTDRADFIPDIYWRGNVWPCVNWIIYKGLRRYGYDDVADALAERSLALLDHAGFWEYWHPLTGEGLGGSTFSWAAVHIDMALDTAERR